MATKLTQVTVEKAKPKTVRYEVADQLLVGLRLTVQPSAAKSWCVRTRVNGKPVKVTLGSFPAIGVARARELGRGVLVRAQAGVNVTDEKREAKRRAATAADDTLAGIAAEYFKREGAGLRTMRPRLRYFERLILPALGARPIGEIRRVEVVQLLDRVQDESGGRTSDLCLAYLSRLFNWHATRADDFRSPLVRGMGHRHKAEPRERILDDRELQAVWRATGDAGVFGLLMRFLLLTGARRSEAAALRWDEIEGSTWVLPASRNKTKVPLARPLAQATQDLLAGIPHAGPYVFSVGTRPIGSLSKNKALLDQASGVTGWRLHDARRTSRSLMSRAGVNADIAEMCMGHVLPRIRGTYDRHEYLAEKKHAFEALAALIERIVNPVDNVTALRG
jgi:integrase